jgi:hypothetical protein
VVLLLAVRLVVADLVIRPVVVAQVTRPVAAATHPAAAGPVIRRALVAQAIHPVAVTRPATERLRGHLVTDLPVVVIRPAAACLAAPRPRKNRMR